MADIEYSELNLTEVQRQKIDTFVQEHIHPELYGELTTRLTKKGSLNFDGRTLKIIEVVSVTCDMCSDDNSDIEALELENEEHASWYAGIWEHLRTKHADLF